MDTIINWIALSNTNKPSDYGWCVTILKPRNYKECEENNEDYSEWIKQCGFNLIWFNNGEFWEDNYKITDRVLYFAKRPVGFINK